MAINKETYHQIKAELDLRRVTLVAVSKTKPVEDILSLYELGHRDFGENYVQELVEKASQLPPDIRWHFIGHLQTNKVKLIAPLVQLIHGVDSLKLLKEINKEGEKAGRVIDCLLQVYIAKEETKFGLDEEELNLVIGQFGKLEMKHARICGLMGMSTFTEDLNLVRVEFKKLKEIFDRHADFPTSGLPDYRPPTTDHRPPTSPLCILSMGMSSDYKIAIEEGSTMVRIGSLLFGERSSKF